jgi:cytochrome c peroxidase
MHNGSFNSLNQVLVHYGNIRIDPRNNNLDRRLTFNGTGQKLNLNVQDVNALVSFLKTLSGSRIFSDPKCGNPFMGDSH